MPRKLKQPAPIEMLASEQGAHWYRAGTTGDYLPSVSTILGALKDGLEYVSPYDLKKACDRGIKIHSATEQLEEGCTLEKRFFSAQEWDMLGGFVNFHREYAPKLVASELKMADAKLGYAGTLDRIYEIDGKTILVDIKTTSAIYDKHWLQVAAYARLAEALGYKIDATAILRLTDRSKAKFQFVVSEHKEHPVSWHKGDLPVFNNHFATWKYLNADSQPKVSELPDTLSLDIITL